MTVTLNRHTSILAGKTEIGNSLLAEAHLPPDGDVFLRLTLLHLLVVVSLLLDQWTKDVLVLVGIFIPEWGIGVLVGGAHRRSKANRSNKRVRRLSITCTS